MDLREAYLIEAHNLVTYNLVMCVSCSCMHNVVWLLPVCLLSDAGFPAAKVIWVDLREAYLEHLYRVSVSAARIDVVLHVMNPVSERGRGEGGSGSGGEGKGEVEERERGGARDGGGEGKGEKE